MNMSNYKGNLAEFLVQAKDQRYITIVTTKNCDFSMINEEIAYSFAQLGLNTKFETGIETNYFAIVNGYDGVYENKSDESISLDSIEIKQFMDLPFNLEAMSSGTNTGSNSTISFDGEDYSKNSDGINIVVYDTYLKSVVCSTCFDVNNNYQHYLDRSKECDNLNSEPIYIFNTSIPITGLKGALSSEVVDKGILINSNSDSVSFPLIDYIFDSNNILVKADIISPNTAVFEVDF